jgi:hypothetical protein
VAAGESVTEDQKGHRWCVQSECGCTFHWEPHDRSDACHPGVVDPAWRYARWQELKRLQRPIADGGEALSLRALARRYRLSAERIRQILEDGPGDYVPEEGTHA